MLYYTGVTNKQDVAIQLSRDFSLQTEIKRLFSYKNYASDIIQDIILQILEYKKEENLVQLCERNEFKFWLFSILKKQRDNPNSYSNTHYKNNIEFDQTDSLIESFNKDTYENDYELQIEKEHKEYLISLIKDELLKINKTNWYRTKIFSDYAQMKEEYSERGEKLTMEKFGKEMQIDKDSLWQIIKKVKIQLKKRIDNEL